jgi:hypothetical protein
MTRVCLGGFLLFFAVVSAGATAGTLGPTAGASHTKNLTLQGVQSDSEPSRVRDSRVMLAQAVLAPKPNLTDGQRKILGSFEKLEITVEGTKPWTERGYQVYFYAVTSFVSPTETNPFGECPGRPTNSPSVKDERTYSTPYLFDKDGNYPIQYSLSLGASKLDKAISADAVHWVIEFKDRDTPTSLYVCGTERKPKFSIGLSPPAPAARPVASQSNEYVLLVVPEGEGPGACSAPATVQRSDLVNLKNLAGGADPKVNVPNWMQSGTTISVFSMSVTYPDCEISRVESTGPRDRMVFDREQQTLALIAGWAERPLVVTLFVGRKKQPARVQTPGTARAPAAKDKAPADKQIRFSSELLRGAGGQLKGLKVSIDGKEQPPNKIKIAGDRPVSVQAICPGYVIDKVLVNDAPQESDGAKFTLAAATPNDAKVHVVFRPTDREVVLKFTGNGAEDARAQLAAGRIKIDYDGEPVVEGKAFLIDPNQNTIDLNLQGFRIKSASAPASPGAVTMPKAGVLQLAYAKLPYEKSMDIVVDIDPLSFKKFKVVLGRSAAVEAVDGALFQFGDKLLKTETLATTQLQFDSSANALELKPAGLRIAAVRPIPEGFARLEGGRVILDRAKLTDTTVGSVSVDFDRVISPGFRIEPFVRIGGREASFVGCDEFRLAAVGASTAGTRLKRTQVDNAAALLLEQEVVGEAFELRPIRCEGVSFDRVPLLIPAKLAGNLLRLQLPIEAKRFYIAVAPRIHQALHGQTTIWQNALQNAGVFYTASNGRQVVNSGVLALEHLRDDPGAVIAPPNLLFPREFPPDDPSIAETIMKRLSGSNTATFEQVLSRLRMSEFNDVTAVHLIAAPVGWSCAELESDYRLLQSSRKNVREMSVVITSLRPIPSPPDPSSGLVALRNAGNARVYKCGCNEKGLNVFAFDASIERNDYWSGAFRVIQDAVLSHNLCR